MEYETFKKEVIAVLGRMLDGGMEVRTGEVTKLNGRKFDSIYIAKSGQEIFPTYYLNDLYEMYEEGEPIESVAYMLLAMNSRDSKVPESAGFIDELKNFEKVRDRILIKLINTDKNRGLLEDMPSVKFLDLSAVFFVVFAEDDFSYQVVVNNNLLETWNKEKKEILKLAGENMKRINHSRIISLEEMLKEEIPSPDFSNERSPVLMISSISGFCGAVYMMDTNLIAHCAENYDDDVIIIPSSIHEILVIPASEVNRENVEEMIREVNKNAVEPKDFLSDHSYFYSRKENRVMI